MKFKVRKNCTVHLEKSTLALYRGVQAKTTRVTSHYEGEIIDLTAEQAADHLTKLEAGPLKMPPPDSDPNVVKDPDPEAVRFLAGAMVRAPGELPVRL